MVGPKEIQESIRLNAEACKRMDEERKDYEALVQKNRSKVLAEGLHLNIQPYENANFVYVLKGEKPRIRCVFDSAKLRRVGPFSTTHVDGIVDREILYECSKNKSHRYCLPPTPKELRGIEKQERGSVYKQK